MVRTGTISNRLFEAKGTFKEKAQDESKEKPEKVQIENFVCNQQKVSYKVKETPIRSRNTEKQVPPIFKSSDQLPKLQQAKYESSRGVHDREQDSPQKVLTSSSRLFRDRLKTEREENLQVFLQPLSIKRKQKSQLSQSVRMSK